MNLNRTIFFWGLIFNFGYLSTQALATEIDSADVDSSAQESGESVSDDQNKAQSATSADDSLNEEESQGTAKQTNDEDGSFNDSDAEEIDTENYGQQDNTYANSPMSIEIQAGRNWLKNGDFNTDFLEFSPSWYLFEDLPIKLGPVIRHEKFIHLTDNISSGQILDIRLRALAFWDFGLIAPYVTLESSIFSLGTMLIKDQVDEATNESGSIKLTTQSHELAVGSQFKITSQLYITAEWTAIAMRHITRDGTLVKTANETKTKTTRKYDQADNYHYMSASLGLLFELN